VFSADTKIGFLSHARQFSEAIAAGKVLAPAKTMGDMSRVVVNDYIDATLAAVFVIVVVATVVYGAISIRRATAAPGITARELGPLGAT
jgi:carbon starvation protein